MKFGVGLPGANPMTAPRWDRESISRGMVEVARRADALGYDWVAAPDHLAIPSASRQIIGPRWYDAVGTLSFVASVTKRVRLLTSVVVLPYRDPFSIAKSIATLDVLSRGRVIFGVGVGHLEKEFATLKVPYAERGPRTDECIQMIRRLWTEESVTFQGRFYQCARMCLDPKPEQRPLPIWIGGNSKYAARRAGLVAEGWDPFQVGADEVRELGGMARQLAAARGHRKDFAVVMPVGPILRNPEAAPTRTQEDVQRRLKAHKDDPEFYRKIIAKSLDPSSLTSAEEVTRQIDGARAAGATHLNVAFRYRELGHYLEALDWFAKEIMPRYV